MRGVIDAFVAGICIGLVAIFTVIGLGLSLLVVASPYLVIAYAAERCAYSECVEHHSPERCK